MKKQRQPKPPRGETMIQHVRIHHERFALIPDDGLVYHIVYEDKQIPLCEVDIRDMTGQHLKRLKWGTKVNVKIDLDPDSKRHDPRLT